jgi:DNA end-binding protein Ku
VRPRANWKGFIKIGELTIPVALYTAASSSERIAFHTLNRKTGNRVHRQFVDEVTEDIVLADDQVKGYEIAKGEYVVLEPKEIAAVVPESDKTLNIDAFVLCDDVDDTYFDRPYYLAPSDKIADNAFVLFREGLRSQNVVAIARTVLFRRVRTVLIRAHEIGLIASTLNFDYEVRAAKDAFADIPKLKIQGEMLNLAKHIIETKRGTFDPRELVDRYEMAVAELVRAKLAGRPLPKRKGMPPAKATNLLDALRQSAGVPASVSKANDPPAAKKTPTKRTPVKRSARKATAKRKTPVHASSHRRKAS